MGMSFNYINERSFGTFCVEAGDGCQSNLFTNFLQTLQTKICLRQQIFNDLYLHSPYILTNKLRTLLQTNM